MTYPTTCQKCEAAIGLEGDLWVDLASGDDGGTYDHCDDGGRHVPAPNGTLPGFIADAARAVAAPLFQLRGARVLSVPVNLAGVGPVVVHADGRVEVA